MAIFSVILIISLIAFVTTRTFGSITKAIEVLEGLTQGDSSQEMPERKGIFVSETDEVGHLSTALKSYKSHLIEMETIREMNSLKEDMKEMRLLLKKCQNLQINWKVMQEH